MQGAGARCEVLSAEQTTILAALVRGELAGGGGCRSRPRRVGAWSPFPPGAHVRDAGVGSAPGCPVFVNVFLKTQTNLNEF